MFQDQEIERAMSTILFMDIVDVTSVVQVPTCDGYQEKGKQEALAQRISSRVEAVCVDSASNEINAARYMARPPDGSPPVTPNLKLIIRDKAHASRRLISRPWACDPYLNQVVTTIIMGSASIVQRIRNSTAISKMYADHVASMGGPFRKTRCLRAAKHRYETWNTPLGRVVMTIEAVIKTAEELSVKRGEWADDADTFLQFITEHDGERFLQLAMLADAGDEVLLVTRLFDDEEVDSATTVEDLSLFRKKIWVLFGDPAVVTGAGPDQRRDRKAGCFGIGGFTTFAMEYLAHGRVVKRRGEICGVLGGPGGLSEERQHNCIGRMQCWLQLCEAVIQAEFPEFEVLQAMAVFNLPSSSKLARDHTDHEQTTRWLERLARAFQVDAQQLQQEFFDIRAIAVAYAGQVGACTNLEAWRHAMQPRRGHSNAVLRHVLVRYAAIGISTTGVEHTFATARSELAQRSGSEAADFTVLKIVRDKPTDRITQLEVVHRAREIWPQVYGGARHGSSPLTKGVKKLGQGCDGSRPRPTTPAGLASTMPMTRPKPVGADSAASWLRARRASVAEAAMKLPSTAVLSAARQPVGWSGCHDKEAAFNVSKKRSRQIEAQVRGQLFEDEHLDCEEAVRKEQRNDSAAFRKRQRHVARAHPTKLLLRELQLKKVYVVGHQAQEHRGIEQRLILAGASPVPSIAECDVIMVPSVLPTSLGSTTMWGAMLVGAWILTPAFLDEGAGPVAKYHAAINFWRKVLGRSVGGRKCWWEEVLVGTSVGGKKCW